MVIHPRRIVYVTMSFY